VYSRFPGESAPRQAFPLLDVLEVSAQPPRPPAPQDGWNRHALTPSANREFSPPSWPSQSFKSGELVGGRRASRSRDGRTIPTCIWLGVCSGRRWRRSTEAECLPSIWVQVRMLDEVHSKGHTDYEFELLLPGRTLRLRPKSESQRAHWWVPLTSYRRTACLSQPSPVSGPSARFDCMRVHLFPYTRVAVPSAHTHLFRDDAAERRSLPPRL